MNILKFFLLITISALTVNSEDICESCSDDEYCNCFENDNIYELMYPNALETFIKIRISPENWIEIECSPLIGYEGYYLLQKLTLGPTRYITFKGCPLPPTSFTDLFHKMNIKVPRELYFESDQSLNNTLQRQHMEGLGYVTTLGLSSSGITGLPEDFLQEFPNLTWLQLNDNDLQYLPTNFFKPTPSIRRINLNNNNFTRIDGIFANLAKLEILYLDHNNLEAIAEKNFSDLVNLQQLDISYNNLQTLPSDVFQYLKNLHHINLSGNNFSAIPKELLSFSPKLISFTFNNNEKRLHLQSNFFSNNSRLKSVELSYNKLTFIPKKIFWNSSSIETIQIRGNLLEILPAELFRDQTNLRNLYLDSNKLYFIPLKTFRNLNQLRVLDLGGNRLQHVFGHLFEGLENLKYLSLNNNGIKYLGNSFTNFLPQELQGLRLDNNNMKKLNTNTFEFLMDTTTINPLKIHNNPWICDCSAVELLILIQSKIDEIPYLSNVTCASDNRPLFNMTMSELCSEN